MRRVLLLVLWSVLLAGPCLDGLDAQSQDRAPKAGQRIARRYLFAAVGFTAGAALAAAYSATERPNTPVGSCYSQKCVATVALVTSTLVGYMVGREFDQLYALRYRGGAPLHPDVTSISLLGEPSLLSTRDSTVAVAGLGGVQLFTSAQTLRASGRRAATLRGIEALDLAPRGDALAVGAGTGFYLYPRQQGPGTLVREGRTSAVATATERVYFATGTRIESAPVTADTTRAWPGLDVGRTVNFLLVDDSRALVWALADSVLLVLRPAGDSLELLGRHALPAPGRRLSVLGTRVAVAMGEGGVILLDAADPLSLSERSRWAVGRYVYDVSLVPSRLYAAAGVEGVYVLGTEGDRLTTIGLARELGFAVALASRGGYTFVVDRATTSLRRIRSDF